MKITKLLAAILAVAMVLGMMAFPAVAEETGQIEFSGGTGLESDPYIIASAEDLSALADAVNNGENYLNTYFKIDDEVQSIDLNQVLPPDETDVEDPFARMVEEGEWTPIGNAATPFKGNFDGNNKPILNLNVNVDEYAGLFGKCADGEIKNVEVNNVLIQAANYAGAIAGCAYTADITNCSVTGPVYIEGNYMVGGITGYTYGDVTGCSLEADDGSYVKASYVQADLEGDNVGGLVGYKGEGKSSISGCNISNIAVSGVRKVGGILGIMMYGNTVSDCMVSNVSVSYNGDGVPAEYDKVFSVGGAIGEIFASANSVNTVNNVALDAVSVTGNENDTAACGLYFGSARNRADLTEISKLVTVLNVSSTNSEAVNADNTYDELTVPGLAWVDSAESFKAALEGEGNVSIKITQNFDINEHITISGKNVTLDLNGCTINATRYFNLLDGTVMTVTDSSVDESGELAFSTGTSNGTKDDRHMYASDSLEYTELSWIHMQDSSFRLEKGTLSSAEKIWGYNNCILCLENSTATVDGGRFLLKMSGAYGTAMLVKNGSTVDFNDGKIDGFNTQMGTGSGITDLGISMGIVTVGDYDYSETVGACTVNLNGGKIEALMGIMGNGGDYCHSVINLSGTEIEAMAPVALQQDTLNMTGSSITPVTAPWENKEGFDDMMGGEESTTAIEVAGGTVNISEEAKVNGDIMARASYHGWPAVTGLSSTVNISGGTIKGDIVSDKSVSTRDPEDLNKCENKITITGGKVTGELQATVSAYLIEGEFEDNDAFEVSGGTFEQPVDKKWLAEGFAPVVDENGNYIVAEAANEIQVRFVPTADETMYDIVLACADDKTINRLNSADLTFKNVNKVPGYEIFAAENITLTTKDTDRYLFNFNGVVPDVSGTEIKIGQVKFNGYGNVVFSVDSAADTNIVNAAKLADNIVDSFVPGGGEGKGVLDLNNEEGESGRIDKEIKVPTQNLTVTVKFPNNIVDNAAAYQQMKATISGGDLTQDIVVEFGGELADNAYTFTQELTQNIAYTVTVEGEGYRTARCSVNMNMDKVLNFWNNVKDSAEAVEEGKSGNEVTKNFLAGEIVKDGKINVYDLSAVVSYFGENNLVEDHPEYAKYDLNRDGKIDSKDVAMVLVSWNE